MINRPTFNVPVIKEVPLEDGVILLFSPYGDVRNLNSDLKVSSQRNICFMTLTGEIKWWVENISTYILRNSPHLKPLDVNEGWKDESHNNIWLEDDKLKSFVSSGYFFEIDLATGSILNMESEKG